jgi:guanylate kinase
MQGQPFVISGPSGTGKSTIIRALRERITALGYSISHTSRKPRKTETNGVDYCFVTEEIFRRMIREGAFVEYAEIYGNFYGTAVSSLGEQTKKGMDVLLDLDAQGARNLKGHFKEGVLIYLLPPSLEILGERLRARGTDDETIIQTRLSKALGEIQNCLWYDYIVINDDLERAIGEVQSIIISERCRTARKSEHVKKEMPDLFF